MESREKILTSSGLIFELGEKKKKKKNINGDGQQMAACVMWALWKIKCSRKFVNDYVNDELFVILNLV